MNRITCIETSDLQRKRIHERVFVRKASNRFFAVCYPFKIDEMPFERLGLFVRKNILPFERLLQSVHIAAKRFRCNFKILGHLLTYLSMHIEQSLLRCKWVTGYYTISHERLKFAYRWQQTVRLTSSKHGKVFHLVDPLQHQDVFSKDLLDEFCQLHFEGS